MPSELGSLSLLGDLKLDSNMLTGVLPDEVCDLTAGGRLQGLFVDCNEVVCTCCNNC